jgi:predicted MFS family arabinose efflux permease
MTCFLLGYGFSALLLTPVIESKLHYRQGLLSSVVIWALICAISPLLGSLMGMLLARIILGIAEGPLFSLKTRDLALLTGAGSPGEQRPSRLPPDLSAGLAYAASRLDPAG